MRRGDSSTFALKSEQEGERGSALFNSTAWRPAGSRFVAFETVDPARTPRFAVESAERRKREGRGSERRGELFVVHQRGESREIASPSRRLRRIVILDARQINMIVVVVVIAKPRSLSKARPCAKRLRRL